MKYIARIDTTPLGAAWYKEIVGAHIVVEDASDKIYFRVVGRVEYVIAKQRCTIIRELPDENPVVSDIIKSTPDGTAKLVSENSDLRVKIEKLESELSAYRQDEKSEPEPFDYDRAMKGEKVEYGGFRFKGNWFPAAKVFGKTTGGEIVIENLSGRGESLNYDDLRMAAKQVEYVTKWVNLYENRAAFRHYESKEDADRNACIDRLYNRAFPIRVPKENKNQTT